MPVLLALVAGCVDTAVVVLEQADAGGDVDGDGDGSPEDTGDEGTDEAADDVPTEDGDAGVCRAGVAGDCAPEELCDVRDCASGATGTCVASPAPCTAEWDPVCGCDGKTYWNDCERLLAGASWSATGACASVDCFPLIPLSTCGTGEICAWVGCSPPPLGGICTVRPSACAGATMCGCNGTTFPNPCEAVASNLPIKGAGPCTILDCTPECREVTAGEWAWWDTCADRSICTASCDGCIATCQAPLGWTAFCEADPLGDHGCGIPYVIEVGLCGP